MLSVLLSLSIDLNAQDFLPPGYKIPSAVIPKPSSSDHLSFDGLYLTGLRRVMYSLQLDRSAVNWADRTLWIDIGNEQDWTPAGGYALFPEGYEGDPNRTVAVIAGKVIKFPEIFSPNASVHMRSRSELKYTISRRDDFLVIAKGAERRWYFESLDGGTEWRLARIERPNNAGQFTVLEYDRSLVTAIVFPNGEKATIEYKGDLPIRIDTPFGESLRFKRGTGGLVNSLALYRKDADAKRPRDVLIETYTFKRDSEGRITAFTAPSGNEYVCEYAPVQQTEENKTRKKITQFTIWRPRDGLFKSRRDEVRFGQEWLMHATSGVKKSAGQAVEESVQDSLVRLQKLGGRWQVVSMSLHDPNQQWTYQFDASNTRMLHVGPNGRTQAKHLDEIGRTISTATADGSTTRIEYNDFSQETRRIDPEGREWVQQFDEATRLTQRMDYDGNVTVFGYDDRGFPHATRIGESVYRFSFDAWGRMTRLQRADGSVQEWVYDGQGRVVLEATTDASSESAAPTATRTYEYRRNRLTSILHQGGVFDGKQERLTYDREGRLRTHADARGRRLSYQYDRRTGWLAGRFDSKGHDELWTYHPVGRMKTHRIRRRGASPVTREYDVTGKLIARVLPDKGRVQGE